MPSTSDIDVLRRRQHGSLVQLKETREAKGLIVQAPGAASSILGRCQRCRLNSLNSNQLHDALETPMTFQHEMMLFVSLTSSYSYSHMEPDHTQIAWHNFPL